MELLANSPFETQLYTGCLNNKTTVKGEKSELLIKFSAELSQYFFNDLPGKSLPFPFGFLCWKY